MRLNYIFDDVYMVDKFIENKQKGELLKDLVSVYNMKSENSVYIGDSLEDVIAARENNITSGAVMWGYEFDKSRLVSEADFYIKSLEVENLSILIEQMVSYFSKIRMSEQS